MNENLITNYSIQAPMYTSYPTVPYWENNLITERWKTKAKKSFNRTNEAEGISLYIHLPSYQGLCTYSGYTAGVATINTVEHAYIDALKKEWEMYLNIFQAKPRIKEIYMGGGAPTFFSPAHFKELLEGILSKAEICENAEFSFEVHPDNTTYEHVKTLYELGFTRLSPGIRNFDPCDQFHCSFMGYTHNHTEFMLGLGVSAISDTWHAFVQNVEGVEEYCELLNKGQLPILRAHLLTEEDLIIRRHILNIMCRFETSWLEKEDQCEGVYNAMFFLREMDHNGLIQLFPYKLVVTEQGKKFIHNICRAFDVRLWNSTPNIEVFSKAG